MEFDLIITTYNRHKKIDNILSDILLCNKQPSNIIIVDSSDSINIKLQQLDYVKYIRSSHKNQPYQRYLGSSISTSDILCFLDDDLEIIDKYIFNYLSDLYSNAEVVGASIGINYENSIFNYVSSINTRKNKLNSLLLWISGVFTPKDGKISYVGMTGKLPDKISTVSYFMGPCMSFRKSIFDKTFLTKLLDIFEQKKGMGEDKVISMMATKFGILMYNPIICLHHPAEESSYFNSLKTFTSKTIYSRYYLSHVYRKIYHKNIIITNLHLVWYLSFRLIYAFIAFVIKLNKSSLQKILGTLIGINDILIGINKSELNWEEDLKKDKNYFLNQNSKHKNYT